MEKRPTIEEYFTPEQINGVKNVMGYPEAPIVVWHKPKTEKSHSPKKSLRK